MAGQIELPVEMQTRYVSNTRMMKTPKGRDAEVTFSGSIMMWFHVRARCPHTDLRAPAGVDYTGRNMPSEASMKKAEDEVLERLDAMIDKLKR